MVVRLNDIVEKCRNGPAVLRCHHQHVAEALHRARSNARHDCSDGGAVAAFKKVGLPERFTPTLNYQRCIVSIVTRGEQVVDKRSFERTVRGTAGERLDVQLCEIRAAAAHDCT